MLNQRFPIPKNQTTTNILNTKDQLKLIKPKKINPNSYKMGLGLKRYGKISMPNDLKPNAFQNKFKNTMMNPTKRTFENIDIESIFEVAKQNVKTVNRGKQPPSVRVVRYPRPKNRDSYVDKDDENDIPIAKNTW